MAKNEWQRYCCSVITAHTSQSCRSGGSLPDTAGCCDGWEVHTCSSWDRGVARPPPTVHPCVDIGDPSTSDHFTVLISVAFQASNWYGDLHVRHERGIRHQVVMSFKVVAMDSNEYSTARIVSVILSSCSTRGLLLDTLSSLLAMWSVISNRLLHVANQFITLVSGGVKQHPSRLTSSNLRVITKHIWNRDKSENEPEGLGFPRPLLRQQKVETSGDEIHPVRSLGTYVTAIHCAARTSSPYGPHQIRRSGWAVLSSYIRFQSIGFGHVAGQASAFESYRLDRRWPTNTGPKNVPTYWTVPHRIALCLSVFVHCPTMGYYVNAASTASIGIVFPILCTVAVCLRFLVRWQRKAGYGPDDWASVVALLFHARPPAGHVVESAGDVECDKQPALARGKPVYHSRLRSSNLRVITKHIWNRDKSENEPEGLGFPRPLLRQQKVETSGDEIHPVRSLGTYVTAIHCAARTSSPYGPHQIRRSGWAVLSSYIRFQSIGFGHVAGQASAFESYRLDRRWPTNTGPKNVPTYWTVPHRIALCLSVFVHCPTMGYYVNAASTASIGIVFPILCTVAVCLRFLVRWQRKAGYGPDDWASVVALILTIAGGVMLDVGTFVAIVRLALVPAYGPDGVDRRGRIPTDCSFRRTSQ
nr:hypothetical protein CFP56_28565 [Quercus suber]